MTERSSTAPRVGVVGMAYPGYHLGEAMCGPKLQEMMSTLGRLPLDLRCVEEPVLTEDSARLVGQALAQDNVDCLLAVIATFVPDHFIVSLLDGCDVPVFLWAVEREMQCISLVCGPLITATLYELGKPSCLVGADIGEAEALRQLQTFARAAMLQRALRTMRVGYVGGKPSIMFSMTADDYTLKSRMGITTVALPIEEYHQRVESVSEEECACTWTEIRQQAGDVCCSEADGLDSTRHCLAAKRLCEEFQLDALSLNCFPHLKSRVCLAMAYLNDLGISAACEGDLHSTIVMHLLQSLTGRAAFNGDFLRMYPETNEVLFSHCGAGAFSLATRPQDIRLRPSIETQDGLAICYPTKMEGPVTLVNLIGARETLRLSVMTGVGVTTDTEYEGTPLRVRFNRPVQDILQNLSRAGAGHHWNGGQGDLTQEFSLLCEFLQMRFNSLTTR